MSGETRTSNPSNDTSRALALLGKITPGPWHVHRPGKHYYIRSDDGMYVLESHSYGVRTPFDAEFIAAAPDLVRAILQRVETLETALRRIADWSDCLCDHGEDCCVKVADMDYHCPGCIAATAIAGRGGAP